MFYVQFLPRGSFSPFTVVLVPGVQKSSLDTKDDENEIYSLSITSISTSLLLCCR